MSMPGPRDYSTGTDMALAHLSGGLCYWPGCPEPILRRVGGEMYFTGQRVHICGANPGSARYDPAMTDDQRRSITNLVAMCKPHHEIIDIGQPDLYPVEVLLRWKAQREASPGEALLRLREVTPSGLRKIVADGLRDHDARLVNALRRLEASDGEAAGLMRNLLDELTEAYSRLRDGIDPDTVDLLHRASVNLGDYLDPDVVDQLDKAVKRLLAVQPTMEAFIEAVPELRRIPPNLGEYL
jgi:hypothetical protein